MWPSYFIYQHKYQQTYQIMECFDTGKLSDSETEKRLRNGPFAENARLQCLARVHHALERSAPDNLPGWCAACWSHRPSSKGSKNSARTAFSVAQDVERSLGSPRMLHGHLHQLHASSISCMLNRRVLKNVTILTGEIYYSTSWYTAAVCTMY